MGSYEETRAQLGLTIDDIATQLNVGPAYIQQIESGDVHVTPHIYEGIMSQVANHRKNDPKKPARRTGGLPKFTPEALRAFRKKWNLGYPATGVILKVHPSMVTKWESNRGRPSRSNIIAINKILRMEDEDAEDLVASVSEFNKRGYYERDEEIYTRIEATKKARTNGHPTSLPKLFSPKRHQPGPGYAQSLMTATRTTVVDLAPHLGMTASELYGAISQNMALDPEQRYKLGILGRKVANGDGRTLPEHVAVAVETPVVPEAKSEVDTQLSSLIFYAKALMVTVAIGMLGLAFAVAKMVFFS